MDIREVPFLLFEEFAVSKVRTEGKYVLEGTTKEGYPLRVEQCERSSHLTLWNYHDVPNYHSAVFSVNAGPSMTGSWRSDRGEQYCESIWSTQGSGIYMLWLPFTPIIGRIMIRAHELWMSNCFETTVTWSMDRRR